jgi:hypothetical protein
MRTTILNVCTMKSPDASMKISFTLTKSHTGTGCHHRPHAPFHTWLHLYRRTPSLTHSNPPTYPPCTPRPPLGLMCHLWIRCPFPCFRLALLAVLASHWPCPPQPLVSIQFRSSLLFPQCIPMPLAFSTSQLTRNALLLSGSCPRVARLG